MIVFRRMLIKFLLRISNSRHEIFNRFLLSVNYNIFSALWHFKRLFSFSFSFLNYYQVTILRFDVKVFFAKKCFFCIQIAIKKLRKITLNYRFSSHLSNEIFLCIFFIWVVSMKLWIIVKIIKKDEKWW